MLKFPETGQSIAVSVTLGLSLLVASGCRHAQHQQQPCPMASSNCYPAAPYTTPGTMPQPDGGYDSPMPPTPEEATPAPREAYAVPQRRNPLQAIKDGSRRLGSKLSRLIKRDEQAVDDEAIGRDRVYSPSQQTPGAYSAQPQLGEAAGGQTAPYSGTANAYPPQVPPADDSDQFNAADENLDFRLPQENIPGDIELPDGNADLRRPQEKLMLPISDPKGDFDLYVPQSRRSTPTPKLTPVPVDEPETVDEFDRGGNEFNDVNFDDEFDNSGPQLLEAPDEGEAKQVKFVPVERDGLNVFQIGTLALCSEVRSYEDFSEIDRNALRAGQELLFYNTLRNIVSVKSAEGFRTLTRSRVEWLGSGDRVLHQVQLSEAPDASRSVRQDYFLTHLLAVPESLPPGLYTVRLTVEDLFGHQAAHSTMQVRVID